MTGKVAVIKDQGQVTGFKVNGKEFHAEDGLVEADIEDLKGFNIGSIPKNLGIVLFEDFETFIYGEGKRGGYACISLSYSKKYWEHKFGIGQYANAFKQAIEIREKANRDIHFDDFQDQDAAVIIAFTVFTFEDMPIDEALKKFREIIKELEGNTERILEGEEISSELLDNEPTFTIELLLPLFRSMGFIDVKYNHSKREFGKDVTFSEIDKFGVRRNYGVQVKVGDLSGEAGAEIDKIIAQIDDAFKIPYIDTTSKERRYISDLIIGISGRFTNNAEDKIIEKVHQRNIYFLNIDKIQELLTKYMEKKLK
jgi:hypothetical protein